MINPDSLGAQGTPFELDIERGKVMEFARAVHAELPAHMQGEHPVTPPTFLTTILFWQTLVDGANPWSLVEMSEERGMHAEQEYVFHGPPPKAGDKLLCTSKITDITEKESRRAGKLTFVKMVTEFRDRDTGRLVAESILTGVETAKPPGEGA